MNTAPTTIEALAAESTGTRVIFEWRDDRFHHSIYGIRRGEPFLIAQSVEGSAASPWPPSPPLQQLHKQPRGAGGEVLFLTGMAGNSHWSGSVSTSDYKRGTEVTIDFACRHRVQPLWLGVTYQLARGVRAETTESATTLKVGNSPKCRIYAAGPGPTLSAALVGSVLTLAAQSTAHAITANTSRWAYAVSLID